jgi:hypothetical protein
MQEYIDKMSELLLEKRLRESKPEDEMGERTFLMTSKSFFYVT